MGKLTRITAEEARQITEESTFILTYIYKNIKEAAKNNLCRTPFGINDVDEKVMENVINTLKEDGYTIVTKDDNGCIWYEINW